MIKKVAKILHLFLVLANVCFWHLFEIQAPKNRDFRRKYNFFFLENMCSANRYDLAKSSSSKILIQQCRGISSHQNVHYCRLIFKTLWWRNCCKVCLNLQKPYRHFIILSGFFIRVAELHWICFIELMKTYCRIKRTYFSAFLVKDGIDIVLFR